jgi:3-hydroxyacyl-[acyl-carrier-protein] dehydratase
MSEADAIKKPGIEADTVRIRQMIPHRYPFLMIDRVVEMVADKRAVGIKNVTINEPHFLGHFPGAPVMPGVLIVEAMAQTAAVLVVHTLGPTAEGKLVYFMSIDNCRFRRPVYPGDRLQIEVVKERNRGPVWKFQGTARVDGKTTAEAVFAAMVREDT